MNEWINRYCVRRASLVGMRQYKCRNEIAASKNEELSDCHEKTIDRSIDRTKRSTAGGFSYRGSSGETTTRYRDFRSQQALPTVVPNRVIRKSRPSHFPRVEHRRKTTGKRKNSRWNEYSFIVGNISRLYYFKQIILVDYLECFKSYSRTFYVLIFSNHSFFQTSIISLLQFLPSSFLVAFEFLLLFALVCLALFGFTTFDILIDGCDDWSRSIVVLGLPRDTFFSALQFWLLGSRRLPTPMPKRSTGQAFNLLALLGPVIM